MYRTREREPTTFGAGSTSNSQKHYPGNPAPRSRTADVAARPRRRADRRTDGPRANEVFFPCEVFSPGASSSARNIAAVVVVSPSPSRAFFFFFFRARRPQTRSEASRPRARPSWRGRARARRARARRGRSQTLDDVRLTAGEQEPGRRGRVRAHVRAEPPEKCVRRRLARVVVVVVVVVSSSPALGPGERVDAPEVALEPVDEKHVASSRRGARPARLPARPRPRAPPPRRRARRRRR